MAGAKELVADFKAGQKFGEEHGKYELAQQMRVLVCALVTAHQKADFHAFWATVEIIKSHLNVYVSFDEEDWDIFRGEANQQKDAA